MNTRHKKEEESNKEGTKNRTTIEYLMNILRSGKLNFMTSVTHPHTSRFQTQIIKNGIIEQAGKYLNLHVQMHKQLRVMSANFY